MYKVKKMLETLEKDLRQNKQYSSADKLIPIIEEAGKSIDEILNELYRIADEANDNFSNCEAGGWQYFFGFEEGVKKSIEVIKKNERG